mgnify:CR=1 FL=1
MIKLLKHVALVYWVVLYVSYGRVVDIMEKIIQAVGKRAEYADVIYDRVESLAVVKDNVEERIFNPNINTGLGVRVFSKGLWRELSIADVGDEGKLLEAAEKLINPISVEGGRTVHLKEVKPWRINVEVKVKKPGSAVPVEDKLEKVRDTYKAASEIDERVVNTRVSYSEAINEKIFLNSEGSNLRQVIPRTRFSLLCVAKEGSRVDYDYLSRGGVAGFELAEDVKEEEITETAKSAIELLSAAQAPAGEMPVILSPSMTGTFAHESFGHGCEADQVIRERSYLINYLNNQVGSDKLTLYDDGTYPGGYGSIIFDDEGVKASRTAIIEKGILKTFLHDRLTASIMGAPHTGNSRRESFLKKPFVRMTNTYISPGDWSLEEMVSGIKYGVLLTQFESGMEDPIAGGMQLKAKKGYLIKKGERSRILSSLSLTGHVLSFVRDIDAVSVKSDFEMDPGTCGKGHEDYVPVGSGGTYIRSRGVVSQG